MTATRTIPAESATKTGEREEVFDLFRRWGYLEANVDPLRHMTREPHPELAITGSWAEQARKIYAGAVGVEFAHIPQPERRAWIQERMEAKSPAVDPKPILERLIRSEVFEQVIQARYLGTKRFSLEGLCGLIPFLDESLEVATANGAVEAVI